MGRVSPRSTRPPPEREPKGSATALAPPPPRPLRPKPFAPAGRSPRNRALSGALAAWRCRAPGRPRGRRAGALPAAGLAARPASRGDALQRVRRRRRLRPALALLTCDLSADASGRAGRRLRLRWSTIRLFTTCPPWGSPQATRASGAIAILAGDGLLTYAFEVVAKTPARAGAGPGAERPNRSRHARHGRGQVLDIDATAAAAGSRSWRSTCARLRPCLARRAAAAGPSRRGRMATTVVTWLASQIADDILSVVASPRPRQNRRQGRRGGKLTYTALRSTRREADRHAAAARAALGRYGPRPGCSAPWPTTLFPVPIEPTLTTRCAPCRAS